MMSLPCKYTSKTGPSDETKKVLNRNRAFRLVNCSFRVPSVRPRSTKRKDPKAIRTDKKARFSCLYGLLYARNRIQALLGGVSGCKYEGGYWYEKKGKKRKKKREKKGR